MSIDVGRTVCLSESVVANDIARCLKRGRSAAVWLFHLNPPSFLAIVRYCSRNVTQPRKLLSTLDFDPQNIVNNEQRLQSLVYFQTYTRHNVGKSSPVVKQVSEFEPESLKSVPV